MAKKPTARQLEYLEAVRDYWARNGFSPALVDVARALEVSTATAHQQMKTLTKKGMLTHAAGIPRSWRVVEPEPRR